MRAACGLWDPSPEDEAEMLAQHIQLTEPMEAFRQTTEDWMDASTQASIAVLAAPYRFVGLDHFCLRFWIEHVKTQAKYIERLLDDHREERLQPERRYPVAVMSINSAQVFKRDFGGMFDISTEPDDDGDATNLVQVYYGLPGSDHREEDDGDEEGAEEEGAEEVVHDRIAAEWIAHKDPPEPVIPIAAENAIKENGLTTTPNEEGFFDFNDLPAERAPVQARPAVPRKEERFKSKKETT
jgi:hypothetical protein